MRSPLFEGIDYYHHVTDLDLGSVRECYWEATLSHGCQILREFPLILRRERYHFSKEVRHRHHDFIAIYIVRGGRGTRMVNGHSYSMARGDVFLMAPDTAHYFRAAADLTLDALYFQPALWSAREWGILGELPDLADYFRAGDEAFNARGHTDHFGHLSPEPHARVESILGEMRAQLKTGTMPEVLAARAQFYALLVKLAGWRTAKTFNTRPARGAGIAEVLAFCDQNFHRGLTNEQLAGLMHLSKSHFRDVFTREVGISPGAYIQHLRLQHAQKLLGEKGIPVSDVARLSGFGDSSQLGRAFKKSFGVSPLDFRKSLKISP